MLGSSPHVPSRLLVGVLHPIAERLLNGSSTLSPLGVPACAAAAAGLAVSGSPVAAALALAVGAWLALAGYMRFIAARRLALREISLHTGGDAAPLVLAFISDFHLGRYKGSDWLARVVEAINIQRPDVVLLGGDFFFNRGDVDPEALLAPLAHLRAPLGVYAIYGNHDYGLPGRDRTPILATILPRLNARPLRNELVRIALPGVAGKPVWVAGMGELWRHDFDFASVRAAYDRAGEGGPLIVLGHNPDAVRDLGPGDRADLFLFGHTHAGQIYLPFWPGFGIPIRGDLYRGEHELAQGRAYVTSGIGETSSSCRLGTTCEIVIVRVH